MSDLQHVLQSAQGLSAADKLVLRDALSAELLEDSHNGPARDDHSLVGLLADELQLADAIVYSAMISRETR